MATETMNRVIAGGPPEGSRLTTGSGETVALISAGNGSCSPNGQHGSASAGSLSEIASQMDGASRQRLLLRPSAEEKEHWPELSKPLCVDLYSGLGGWSEAFIAEGYRCIGFDLERHDYGTGGYPGELILRDVRSIHGSELKDAAVIVASPPCQEPSYRAMCWKRAKALTPEEVGVQKPAWWDKPEKTSRNKKGKVLKEGMTVAELLEWSAWKQRWPKPKPELFITLFNECFRIQREAIEAAGHHIPMIVENVRGAQKWVGMARWNYGSFYLWGDVPALMPHTFKGVKTEGYTKLRDGHSHTRHLTNPAEFIGRKVSMNFHEHEKTGKPGRSFESAAVAETGIKFEAASSREWFDGKPRDKMLGHNGPAAFGSKSNARKAASAMIAKIPYPLAQWIARAYYPSEKEASA